ncbi:MAG: plasmid replication protein, CyRepA1 family [Potamolinea sp.]
MKEDAKGWASFIKNDVNYSQEERERARREWEQQKRQRALSEAQRRHETLLAEVRDPLYQDILTQLSLAPIDRKNLTQRGFSSEEIVRSGFTSVVKWQPLEQEVSYLLPGVSIDGKSLITQPGFLCPVRDVYGKLVGIQVRLRDAEDGRYRWLSSRTKKRPHGQSPHLPNGELPLAVFRPTEVQQKAIALVEGTGPKPFLASERLGQVVVGAAGGQWTSSALTLWDTLSVLSEEVGTKQITLYPDAGDILNRHVLQRWKRVIKLLQAWRYEVKIAWWGQATKESPDIDEIPLHSLKFVTQKSRKKGIQLLTPEEFFQVRTRGIAIEKSKAAQKALNTLTYPPTQVLSQPYLTDIHLPKPGSFLFVSSPMNTGKTTLMGKLIEEFEARHPDGKVREIGYRNGLLRQTGEKLKISLAADLELDTRRNTLTYINYVTKVSLCIDSLLKLDLAKYDGALILLDEVDAVLRHLFLSETCDKHRAQIMTHFRALLRHVITTNGYIVCMEANLTDLALDTLRNITGADTPMELVVNDWKSQPWEVTLGSGSDSGFIHYLVSRCLEGEKLIVATDSQRFAERLERIFAKRVPAAKVFRADGKTAETPEVREFLTKPNQVIEREQPDLLIYSPTMESGGDITSEWFDRMGFYLVNLETRAQVQMLGRVRPPIPRVGYVLEYANPDESGRTLRPEVLKRDLRTNVAEATQLTQLAVELAKQENPNKPDWLKKLNELLNPNLETPEELWVTVGCQYQCRWNGARADMRANLVKALESAGHRVTECDFAKFKEIKEVSEEIKEELEEEEATKLSEADDAHVTPDLARRVLESPGATEDERFQARKALLRERLPGLDLTQDFLLKAVVQENGYLLQATTLLWYCQNSGVVHEQDRKKLTHHLKQPFVYLPKVKEISPKVALFQRSGILALIGDREYRNTDEDLALFREWAFSNRWEIRRVLGLDITERQNAIEVLSKFLKKVGYKLESRRLGSRGARQRVYRIVNLNDGYRQEILEALTQRFEVMLEASACEDLSTNDFI